VEGAGKGGPAAIVEGAGREATSILPTEGT
jgi:hypothetical protein